MKLGERIRQAIDEGLEGYGPEELHQWADEVDKLEANNERLKGAPRRHAEHLIRQAEMNKRAGR